VNKTEDDAMREEYEFEGAVRSKHAAAFARRKGVIVLAPDVAAVFPDAESANAALRMLIETSARAASHPVG
jgi:hypothetical protein